MAQSLKSTRLHQNVLKPVIALTVGDPAGIGPEIVAAALRSKRLPAQFEYQIVGGAPTLSSGKASRDGARFAWEMLERAVKGCLKGEYAALVTGPICKESLARIGFHFPGQSEFLAARSGLPEEAITMSMISPRLRVFLLSTHVPLKKAISMITPKRLEQTIRHAFKTLQSLHIQKPRLAIAGLNPHAGENGLIGREENELLIPALKKIRKKLKLAEDTLPIVSPDTVFYHAAHKRYDGVICLYHDQGLIPFKLLSFENGVNYTAGLPFIRTSPDHGTAFDIAGQKLANPKSMIAAIRLATQLLMARK